ncbi:DUF397 domain-containing protein [Streptomyces sp. NPDC006997]|uniref:DUF397 domain-containing protein n=1 Tax=Streptomyces sp. NPDC006997 TaxID=3155356 RepID=UPI0033FED3C1
MKRSEPTISDASMLSGWRKSSHSGGDSGDCLEVNDEVGAVRDSKNPTGPALVFSPTAWRAFLTFFAQG